MIPAQSNGLNWQSAFMADPVRPDPYSHQISFIFPDWIERFNRAEFRELIEGRGPPKDG